MILTGEYVFVFKIQVATGMLAAVLYNAAYFALRLRRPEMHRPFRAIGHPVLPALILMIATALFAGVAIADPTGALWVAGLIGICVPVGIELGRRRRIVARASAS
jgi:APA family basic amino acid/polyamine antiporter